MGREPLGSMFIELGLDTTKFNPELTSAKRAVKYFQQEVRGLDAVMRGNGTNLIALKAKYNSLKNTIESQKNVLRGLKKEFESVEKGSPKWEQKAVAIERENAKLAQMEAQLKGVGRAMEKLALQDTWLGKLSTRLDAAGQKITNFGKGMERVGQGFNKTGDFFTKAFTAPIVGGVGLAVKAAIDYESAFTGVKKTVDEAVDANGKVTVSYKDLSNGIRQMAKELPSSAVEIANVAETAGQLGIKTEDILKFSRTMIDMGESTNLSANDAATAIAKIANITGMTSDEYQRFGSSVVALGNNFATTERDIVEMANRLASSGHIAGLTNQEILGLATAMSSVGIEAEAGGSAMSQALTTISKAVSNGGSELETFAKVSGMTSKQFSQAWKDKPAEALQTFIKGLSGLKDKGIDVNNVLDDLGLSGIRQSNMLKSLSSASGVMTKAVDMSNKAWKENTALSKEASTRYESTASKLKMLRNQVTDTAIEFGGPLVDALRDGLEASKPLIQKLADLAKAFSSLSKDQQRNIIKWGAVIAAIGPVSKVFGGVLSTIGGVSKGFGSLLEVAGKTAEWANAKRGIEGVATAATGATSVVGGLGTGMAGAAGKTGLLAGAVGLLGNPVTWGVILGGVAVGAVAYFAHKANEARQRTEEWGAKVSETQANDLQKFKNKVDETNRAITVFGTDSTKNVDSIAKAFKGLSDEIEKLSNKKLAKILKSAAEEGLSNETIETLKKNSQNVVNNAKSMSDQVLAIYKNASKEHRQLTADENEIVLNNQQQLINKQLELMNFSKKERTSIQKAMNGELNSLNQSQLEKALSVTEKWIKDENSSYKKRKSNLEKSLEEIRGTSEADLKAKKEINAKIEALEAEHTAKMNAFTQKYVAIRKKLTEKMRENGWFKEKGSEDVYWKQIEKQMKSLGLSYDELQNKMRDTANSVSQTSGMVAKYTADMTEETKSAVTYWNSIVLDTKTGKVKTNAQEEIQKALQAEGGWNNIKLAIKEGKLETTAKVAIGEALQATGQWNSLTPAEKTLVTNNKPAIEAILSSKEMLNQWNGLPENVKKILGENQSFLNSAEGAKQALATWNFLPTYAKELLAKDLTGEDVNKAQQAVNSLTGNTVIIDADNKTGKPALDAQLTINGVKQTVPARIEASNNTQSGKDAAQQTIDSTEGKTVDISADPTKAQIGTTEGKLALNSYSNHPVPVRNLLGNPNPVINASNQGKGSLGSFNAYPVQTKQLPGNANSAVNASSRGKSALGSFNAFGVPIKNINARDNATAVALGVMSQLSAIPSVVTTVINVVKKFTGLETGTNYHEGGPAIVNDQKGPTFKEMVQYPSGETFIPEGRNVLLDLPKGSKVFPARKTRRLMQNLGIPKYQNGVGISSDAKFIREMESVKNQIVVSSNENNMIDIEKIVNEISDMKSVISTLLKTLIDKDDNIYLDGNKMAESSYRRQARIMAREGI